MTPLSGLAGSRDSSVQSSGSPKEYSRKDSGSDSGKDALTGLLNASCQPAAGSGHFQHGLGLVRRTHRSGTKSQYCQTCCNQPDGASWV